MRPKKQGIQINAQLQRLWVHRTNFRIKFLYTNFTLKHRKIQPQKSLKRIIINFDKQKNTAVRIYFCVCFPGVKRKEMGLRRRSALGCPFDRNVLYGGRSVDVRLTVRFSERHNAAPDPSMTIFSLSVKKKEKAQ